MDGDGVLFGYVALLLAWVLMLFVAFWPTVTFTIIGVIVGSILTTSGDGDGRQD